MNNRRFIIYALMVAFMSVISSWGEMFSSGQGRSARLGSSWSSTSGSGSWGSGGHK